VLLWFDKFCHFWTKKLETFWKCCSSPNYLGNTRFFVSSRFLSIVLPELPFSLSLALFTPSFVCRSFFLPSLSFALAFFACASFLSLSLSLSLALYSFCLFIVCRSYFFPYNSFARLTSFACVSQSSFLIVHGLVFFAKFVKPEFSSGFHEHQFLIVHSFAKFLSSLYFLWVFTR
jgi:hypothetical protein